MRCECPRPLQDRESRPCKQNFQPPQPTVASPKISGPPQSAPHGRLELAQAARGLEALCGNAFLNYMEALDHRCRRAGGRGKACVTAGSALTDAGASTAERAPRMQEPRAHLLGVRGSETCIVARYSSDSGGTHDLPLARRLTVHFPFVVFERVARRQPGRRELRLGVRQPPLQKRLSQRRVRGDEEHNRQDQT